MTSSNSWLARYFTEFTAPHQAVAKLAQLMAMNEEQLHMQLKNYVDSFAPMEKLLEKYDDDGSVRGGVRIVSGASLEVQRD